MKIALFRPLGVGSLLCAVPALRALDAAYPGAHITLIGLPHLRELAARLRRYLDGFAAFPGLPGLIGPDCDLDAVPDLGFGKRGLEKYVCLHCGVQPQRFAELGDALAAEGWNVVLTGNAQVAAAMREPAISLAGRTSLTHR